MVTKTLTITEDAYKLLKQRKRKGESFSEEITRIMKERKKQNLQEYFGILDKNRGAAMLKELKKIKKDELKLLKRKLK